MPDEHDPESRYEAIARWLARAETPPTEFTELAEALLPFLESVPAPRVQLDPAVGSGAFLIAATEWVAASLPVPTNQELSEADAELRARVLPETSEQELVQAVEEIPADPEQLKLAAFLTDLLQRVPPVPAPWIVFVLVFWVAMKMNPNVVGALALAYAVAYNVTQGGGKSGT
jgi:hypothetical protein